MCVLLITVVETAVAGGAGSMLIETVARAVSSVTAAAYFQACFSLPLDAESAFLRPCDVLRNLFVLSRGRHFF